MINDPVKTLVFEALDRAKDNVDELFLAQPTSIIAIDMVSYESTLEGVDPEILEPYIELWKAKENAKK